MSENKQQYTDEEISLKDFFLKFLKWVYFLQSKWKIIVVVGLMGAFIGLAYSFIKKPIYTATLTFALEDENGGGAIGLASSLGLDIGGGSGGGIFSSSNLTELFKSRAMVEKALLTPVSVNRKTISLAEMYIQNNKWRDSWNKEPKYKNIQFLPNIKRKDLTRVHDSILGVIYNRLSEKALTVAQKDKKTTITSIDVFTTDELFSLYFCEALAKQVGKFYVDTKSKKARINMNILNRQRDSIRVELNSAITGVAIATDNTFMLNPALNVQRSPSVRRQVDVQANTAILTELVRQTELAKVALRKETPLIQVIDRPVLPLPNDKLGRVKGFLLGGILFGLLAILYLTLKRIILRQ
ncbi:Wzz/FepE/Etk N-terminal domain-containing protein [Flavobacterium adhaerens]|uniref:Wzz/FepE/Etk N-terminal domain-containing protein n=1 Tax=Flavobacterium adhaerens TaxID=3149043 RepID=UPI0032B40846